MSRKYHMAGVGERKTLCRTDDYYPDVRTDPGRVTCTACLGILDRQTIEARPVDAPKIELVKFEGISGYRFSYKAMVGGEHVGFVVMDGAYKQTTWKVCGIRLPTAKDRREINFELSQTTTYASGLVSDQTYSYPTKERALLACVDFVASGDLKTEAVLMAEAFDQRIRWNEAKAKRHAADRYELDTLANSIEALESVLKRDDLTNFERDGLLTIGQQMQGLKLRAAQSVADNEKED